jgi:hypothetical protein
MGHRRGTDGQKVKKNISKQHPGWKLEEEGETKRWRMRMTWLLRKRLKKELEGSRGVGVPGAGWRRVKEEGKEEKKAIWSRI